MEMGDIMRCNVCLPLLLLIVITGSNALDLARYTRRFNFLDARRRDYNVPAARQPLDNDEIMMKMRNFQEAQNQNDGVVPHRDRTELVAEGKYCKGTQGKQQWTATVHNNGPNVCALLCEREGYTMFIYGIEGTGTCDAVSCACYCQPSASADGTCEQVDAKDNSGKNTYNLYKIKELECIDKDIAECKKSELLCFKIDDPKYIYTPWLKENCCKFCKAKNKQPCEDKWKVCKGFEKSCSNPSMALFLRENCCAFCRKHGIDLLNLAQFQYTCVKLEERVTAENKDEQKEMCEKVGNKWSDGILSLAPGCIDEESGDICKCCAPKNAVPKPKLPPTPPPPPPPFQCTTCVGMQGKSANCEKKVCSKGMNRCLAMTLKATSGGKTMNLWMRQCSDNHFCSLDDVTACALTQQNLGGAYSLSECKKACSSSKDARMPAFPSSSGSPSCVCTAEYEIKIKGVSVLAHCDDWEGDGVSWCYLAGGMNAEHCPGARKSGSGDFYWTKDTAICQAAGTKREADYDAAVERQPLSNDEIIMLKTLRFYDAQKQEDAAKAYRGY